MEVFIHGLGIPEVRDHTVDATSLVQDLVRVAKDMGFPRDSEIVALVFIGEHEEPVDHHLKLEDVGICEGSEIHVHTCREISVSCNYAAQTKLQNFAPTARIKRVKDAFAREFGVDPHDFGSFVLLTCKEHSEPDENTRIGSLTTYPRCDLCFDLVKRENVQG